MATDQMMDRHTRTGTRNGAAVAAMVCGAAAFPCVDLGLMTDHPALLALALLLSAAAVVLGALGRARVFRTRPAAHGNWMAYVGVTLGAIILTGAGLVAL